MDWIFSYGSFVQDWDIDYDKRTKGTLKGYHRDFNVRSVLKWGEPGFPAPVLGLEEEEGTECEGIVFGSSEEKSMVSEMKQRNDPVYRLRKDTVFLEDDEVEAHFFMNDPEHESYIGDVPLDKRAEMCLETSGKEGRASDHVYGVKERLEEFDIEDEYVESFVERLEELQNP
ncbi:MAG: gamma-glutamylcyclotransferase [Candidatus Aenigmatarchaeota archaeon]